MPRGVAQDPIAKSTLPQPPTSPIFPLMKAAKQPASKPRRPTPELGPMYRGIHLQPYVGPRPSRFTREQIEQAVDAAILKNADALAGKTKT